MVGYFEYVRGFGPTLLDVFALFRGFAHGIFGPEKNRQTPVAQSTSCGIRGL